MQVSKKSVGVSTPHNTGASTAASTAANSATDPAAKTPANTKTSSPASSPVLIELHPESDTPLFRQLHDQIVLAIARNQLLPGQRLSSVRTLATDFGINPATVQKAYKLLRENGVITSTNRSGNQVAINPQANASQLTELSIQLRNLFTLAKCQGASAKQLSTISQDLLEELS